MLFDSMMTYYSRYGITNDEGYAQLSLFVDSVLRPINEAFAANIDSTNFEIRVSISELKKNPYAINLLGVRTVEETGIVQQVSKPSSQQIPFAETKNTPKEFSLEQNYPNPFNPTTILSFVIGNSSLVTMKIYNVLGQEVATLLNNEELESGKHEIEFDGSKLSSGVYFYRLQVSEEGKQIFTETKKLVLMK
ncbi:MAG: T9SS type A sorting domain-containing protein [Ignavibacteriales bacterium]|nr:T9SS type A sorting domain-containing protein [Ignavibacteriales bacterium]